MSPTAMQCDPTCSNYHACIPSCPVETCDNLMHPSKAERLCNQDVCVEGCLLRECPAGSVYSNNSYIECVPKSACKPVCLEENGVTYYEGDVMASDLCHSCKCTRGSKVCTGIPCAIDMPDVSCYNVYGFHSFLCTLQGKKVSDVIISTVGNAHQVWVEDENGNCMHNVIMLRLMMLIIFMGWSFARAYQHKRE